MLKTVMRLPDVLHSLRVALARWPWLLSVVLGGAALGLYLVTLAPTVTFADAGELAAAVYFLDVAHPPGFPLYLLLGKGFTLLVPWGRFIVRLNAFSALCAAVAVGLFSAALLVGMGETAGGSNVPGRRRRAGRLPAASSPVRRPALLPALVAAGLLAVSRTFWEQATLTEVYALNMALAAGLLLLLALYLRAREQGRLCRADRLLAAAALLAGLGLGNHLTLLFIAVAVPVVAWIEEGRGFWRPRRLLLAGLFCLGLAVYLYLPLRARADPPLNWGNPDTLVRFWRHISGKQYRVSLTPGWETWQRQLAFFLPRLWGEFSPLPLLLLPLGVYRLFRRRPSLAWGSLLSAAVILLYALSYEIAEDQETYYMLFFLLAAWWMGEGVALLRNGLGAAGRPVLAALFPLLLLWPLWTHYPLCDRHAYTYAEAYARDLLDNLPPNALLLTRHWNLFAPAYYLQQVEGVRPDLLLLDQELFRRSWYLETLERRFPDLMGRVQGALSDYREELSKFEADRPYDFATIQARYQGLSNALINVAVLQGRPVVLTPEVEYRYGQTVDDRYLGKLLGRPAPDPDGVGERYIWVPQALGLALHGEPPESVPWETFRQPALGDNRPHDSLTERVVEQYVQFWLRKAFYFHAGGDCTNAVPAYEKALAIDETLEVARQGILDCRQRNAP